MNSGPIQNGSLLQNITHVHSNAQNAVNMIVNFYLIRVN